MGGPGGNAPIGGSFMGFGVTIPAGDFGGASGGCSWRWPDNTIGPAPNPPGAWKNYLVPTPPPPEHRAHPAPPAEPESGPPPEMSPNTGDEPSRPPTLTRRFRIPAGLRTRKVSALPPSLSADVTAARHLWRKARAAAGVEYVLRLDQG